MELDLNQLTERGALALASVGDVAQPGSESVVTRALACLAEAAPSRAEEILAEVPELGRYAALQLVEELAREDGLDPAQVAALRSGVLASIPPNALRARDLSRAWLRRWTEQTGCELPVEDFLAYASWGPTSSLLLWASAALCAQGRARDALPFAERLGPLDRRQQAEAFAAIGLALPAGEAREAALERAAKAGNLRPMIQEGAEETEAHGTALAAFAAGGLPADHPAVQIALKGALRLAKKRARKDSRAEGFSLGALGAARRARDARDPAWFEVAERLRSGIHDAAHALPSELQLAFAERALGREERAAARLAALPDGAFGVAALREAPEATLELLWERRARPWAIVSALEEQGLDPQPYLDGLVPRARRVNGEERSLLRARGHADFAPEPAAQTPREEADQALLLQARAARAAGEPARARALLLAGGARALHWLELERWVELIDREVGALCLERARADARPRDRWRLGLGVVGALLARGEREAALAGFALLTAASAQPEQRDYAGRVRVRYPEEQVWLRREAAFAGDFAAALKEAGAELKRLIDLARQVEGDPAQGKKVLAKLRKAKSGRELHQRARKQAGIAHGQLLLGQLDEALATLAKCPSSHYWEGVASGSVLVAQWLASREEEIAPEQVDAVAAQLGRLHPQVLAPALSAAVPPLLGRAREPEACEERLRQVARAFGRSGDLAPFEAALGQGWALRGQGERAERQLRTATERMGEPASYLDRSGLSVLRALLRADALTPLPGRAELVEDALVAYASQPDLGPGGAIARLEWAAAELWQLGDVTSAPALVHGERLGVQVREGLRDSLLVDSAALAPRPLEAALAIFSDEPPTLEVARAQLCCLADALEREGQDPSPLRALTR